MRFAIVLKGQDAGLLDLWYEWNDILGCELGPRSTRWASIACRQKG